MPARNKNNMDFTLLITVLILLAIGVAMVFSASSISSFMKYNDRYHYLKSQGFFAILGILAMLFMSKLDYRILGRFAGALALLSIVLLIAVFIPGIGHTANEATRWIKIGSQTMQPSEFAKFALIIFMAKSISNKKEKIRSFKHGVLPYVILAAIYFVLIILEPNLSMAGSILMITFAMLFAAGTKIIYLVGWLIPILPAVGYII
ncbi:MAG TPA: FtsW/RodA/SpoVE family cell cycle protein, partial [Bacillota bacterium]|nr:FtsW/RodA/SpoVE family cell cycle protein [Bacillota bacterium]